MPQFTTNADRFDPYKTYKFRVRTSDGNYVAGVSKVSGLKRTMEVVKHRQGGDPSTSRRSPGQTEYDAVTLERGVTHDVEFAQWANRVRYSGSGLGEAISIAHSRRVAPYLAVIDSGGLGDSNYPGKRLARRSCGKCEIRRISGCVGGDAGSGPR